MNRALNIKKINDSLYCVKIAENEYTFSFNMPIAVVIRKLSQHEFLSKEEKEQLLRGLKQISYER